MPENPDVERGDGYVTAVVICEVRNSVERRDFDILAGSIGRHGDVRLIADGLVTAYIVRLPAEGAPLLTALHVTLRNEFVYGQVVLPVQETVLGAIKSLAEDTGGSFHPSDACSICGAETWFPTGVQVRGEDGRQRPAQEVYCSACAETIADPRRNGKAPKPARVEAEPVIA